MAIICFDLDNTLINSIKAYHLALNLALKDFNLKEISFEKFGEYFGISNKNLIKNVYPKLHEDDVEDILKLRTKYYLHNTIKLVDVIPGVKLTLSRLSKKHILVLLSNATHERILSSLKQVGIDYKLFKFILGHDDVGAEKPSIKGIQLIENRLKKKIDYIVGDSVFDLITGNKAKIKSIAVLSGVNSVEKLKKYKPYKIIKDVSKIEEVI
jgi:phosphoglycolate phosphatase-like HAD superfamily hydrolase